MFLALLFAFLAGALAAAVAFVAVARSRMILVGRSPLGFEETVAAVERGAADTEGWSSPGVRDLNAMMARNGVAFEPRVKLVEICKAKYAARVLKGDRRLATLLPCAIAVYEDDAGQVWFSRLNVALMGRIFGGDVAEVMGRGVAGEERQILRRLHPAVPGGRQAS